MIDTDRTPMRAVVTGLTRTEGNEAVERLGGTSGSMMAKTDLVVVGARSKGAGEFAALLTEHTS